MKIKFSIEVSFDSSPRERAYQLEIYPIIKKYDWVHILKVVTTLFLIFKLIFELSNMT